MKVRILAVCLLMAITGVARAESNVDPYAKAYTASIKDHLPVVVFVGQPVREVPGTRTVTLPKFHDAAGPCVVVGVVRDGEMLRQDLGGTPTTTDIQGAIASLSKPALPDALDEVNAARAARGLRPYIRDPYLTAGATACAEFRATRLIAGHTGNDFAALPPGGYATSSGCAAWEPGFGWGSCCTYEGYTYAGAAYAMGRDGRRYMHLFVR